MGPVVNALVGVTPAHSAALKASGLAVPPPVPARLLIDTGATSTNLCRSVVSAAGLMQTGAVQVHTPSTAGQSVTMPQYDTQLIIPLDNGHFILSAIPVICADFSAQGIQGLLGRDVLAQSMMIYHGDLNLCTLSF